MRSGLPLALVAMSACGARPSRVTATEGPTAKPAASIPGSSSGPVAGAPASWPSKTFFVKVEGRCSAWEVRDGVARNRRQTALGEVAVEMSLDPGPHVPKDGGFGRFGPVDRLRERLDGLACPTCVQDPEESEARHSWVTCSSPVPARWYEDEGDCLRAAGPSGEPGSDGAADGGHDVTRCAFAELTSEGMRRADAEDSRDYDEMQRRVEAAEAEARVRLRSFESQISRTRRIFVRDRVGSGGGPCESWSVRQDQGSPSGWISREEKHPDGSRELAEFRFAARPDLVELTGWINTDLPTSAEERGAVSELGSPCTSITALVDVSAARVKFSDQIWYLSAQACATDSKKPDPDANGFGPSCGAHGR